MDPTKRRFLTQSVLGAGSLGLASLATGLPASFLADPRRALAQGMPMMCASRDQAQFLILSTTGGGCPLNTNVPGTYDDPAIVHPSQPGFEPTEFTLGPHRVRAARLWSTLPEAVRARTSFFHHATYTNNHLNQPKVLRLMGATRNSESLPSIYARYLGGCLDTVRTAPVLLGQALVEYEGRPLTQLLPTTLRYILGPVSARFGQLETLRDRRMDEIHAVLREGSTAPQRSLIDRYVNSRTQARSIGQGLLGTLNEIPSDRDDGQALAAVALIQMRISPIMIVSISFGGDNHGDPNLEFEAEASRSGIARIAVIQERLRMAGLQDRVTFAALNVFGRTLKMEGAGRGHHPIHHAGVVISSRVRPGVIGGLAPEGREFGAVPIDSRTGRGGPGGDIPRDQSLESYAKTLGRVLGLPAALLDDRITRGRVVEAALA